jgi:hypothetical protein
MLNGTGARAGFEWTVAPTAPRFRGDGALFIQQSQPAHGTKAPGLHVVLDVLPERREVLVGRPSRRVLVLGHAAEHTA